MDLDEEMGDSRNSATDYLTTSKEFTSSFFTTGGDLLKTYGWFLLGGAVIVGLYWQRIQKFFDDWYVKREAARYAAKYHKNPDLALKRMEELQAARERMQEELNRKSLEHKEKMKERERRRLEEKIAAAEGKLGGHLLGDGTSTRKDGGSSHASDYNPLMGAGSSRYVPPRRSGCPGGGCGRR